MTPDDVIEEMRRKFFVREFTTHSLKKYDLLCVGNVLRLRAQRAKALFRSQRVATTDVARLHFARQPEIPPETH